MLYTPLLIPILRDKDCQENTRVKWIMRVIWSYKRKSCCNRNVIYWQQNTCNLFKLVNI